MLDYIVNKINRTVSCRQQQHCCDKQLDTDSACEHSRTDGGLGWKAASQFYHTSDDSKCLCRLYMSVDRFLTVRLPPASLRSVCQKMLKPGLAVPVSDHSQKLLKEPIRLPVSYSCCQNLGCTCLWFVLSAGYDNNHSHRLETCTNN